MLMRAGRGNDGIRTVEQTQLGELVLECPACPNPAVNLPPDWNDPENAIRFIYLYSWNPAPLTSF